MYRLVSLNTTGLVFGNRAAQTERVMNAIFLEDSMRLFHRVLLEMGFADKILAAQHRTSQPAREIIELDEDDEVMGEGNQATMNQGECLLPVACQCASFSKVFTSGCMYL